MLQVESVNANSIYFKSVEDVKRNNEQYAALNSNGHTIVLAGPGSGKTKILTLKVAKILTEEVHEPRKVACLTYNNQCARELIKKLNKLNVENGKYAFIGTVHSFCLTQIIIPYATLAGINIPDPLTVATSKQQDEFLQEAIEFINKDINPNYHKIHLLNFRKTVIFRDSKEWLENDFYRPMVEKYENILIENGVIDFDGMVLMSANLIKENLWIKKAIKAKFPVLIIDEYQDLGVALHQMVLDLCMDYGVKLFAVGDPDQSIYGFNGARPNLLKNLANLECIRKIELSLNYRCGNRIIQTANAMLDRSVSYKSAIGHKSFVFQYECPLGFNDQLLKIFKEIIPNALLSGTQLGEIGILYPNQNDGQLIANAAKKFSFDYIRFDNGNPYRRTIITAWLEECARWCAGGWKKGEPKLSQLIFDWLRFNPSLSKDNQILEYKHKLVKFLFNNRNSSLMLWKWLENSVESGLFRNLKAEPLYLDGYNSLKELYDAVKLNGVYEQFTVGSFSGQNGSETHLNLSTMHSAKGLEYEIVILPGLEEGKVPYTYQATQQQLEEARRLFYVSLTRAKREIHLLWSGFTVNRYGRKFYNGKSRFLSEIDKIVI